MNQCVYCQGELESRHCQQCGRAQPEMEGTAPVVLVSNQASDTTSCPTCGEQLPAHAGVSSLDRSTPGVERHRPFAQAPNTWPGRVLAVALVIVVAVASAGLYLSSHDPAHPTRTPLTGQGTTASPSPSLSPTLPITPTVTPDQLALTFNGPAAANVGGLHIQTDGLFCGRYLILAQPQYSYDDATIAQMRSYVSSLAASIPLAKLVGTASLPGNLPPLPDTLRWATGAGVIGPSGGLEEGCAGTLTITNTGATPLQIAQFGVIYANDSAENTYPYRLVDACTLLQLSECPSGLGSNRCDPAANISLADGPAGTIMTTPVGICPLSGFGDPIISPQIVAPAQTTVLRIRLVSSSHQGIYRVHLMLGISTEAAGATLLTLPTRFDSMLVFTKSFDPFSSNDPNMVCYGLQGNTFAPLPLPPAAGYGVFVFESCLTYLIWLRDWARVAHPEVDRGAR